MKYFLTVVAIILLIGAVFFGYKYANQSHTQSGFQVTEPARDALVKSPLKVMGVAPGGWFFEAVFPARLEDGNGNVLGRGTMTATDDWMKQGDVPFAGTIEFVTPTTDSGTLIFEKDNPSGLPEHGGKFKVPVRFR